MLTEGLAVLTAINTLVAAFLGYRLKQQEFQAKQQRQQSADVYTLVNELQEERRQDRANIVLLTAQNRDLSDKVAKQARLLEVCEYEHERDRRLIAMLQAETEKRQPSLIQIDSSTATVVLIIEDERVSAAILLQIMRKVLPPGFSPVIMPNAADGLQVVQELPVALSLVDLELKNSAMGGIGFIRAAKDYRPDMRVIVISGHGADSHEGRPARVVVEELGGTYLEKPADMGKLLPLVRQALHEWMDEQNQRARAVTP